MSHATSTAVTIHPTGSSRGGTESSQLCDGLGAYMRWLAELEVMSREEELAAATRIAGARREFWAALLGRVATIGRICELARAHLPAETCPVAAIAAMEAALAGAGDVAAARAALVEAMAEADVDGVVSGPMLTEVLQGRVDAEEAEDARYRAEVQAAHVALVAAKNAFVEANLRLVVTIARAYGRGGTALQDLIQEGNLGLMKAVDRFDPRRGCRFSTYAAWWIRHAIGRSIHDKARSIRVPAQMVSASRKIGRVCAEFELLHGRRPTDDELVALTGIRAVHLERIREALMAPVSLDQPLGEDDARTLLDTLGDETQASYTEAVDVSLMQGRLERALASLSPIEAEVLRARVGMDTDEETTLRDLGRRLSLSRERVRQIQEAGLKKLRRAFMRRDG
ncbi:MAG TPA: sigma-70 family RNA polymerase sigma factor [Nannocystis sp.]